MDEQRVLKNRSINLVLLAISGTAGIAAVFLPFTRGLSSGISPMDVIIEFLKECYKGSLADGFVAFFFFLSLALPFFLSILVSVAYLRVLFSGQLSRLERTLAYIVGAMMAIIYLFSLIFVTIIEFTTKALFDPIWWLIVPVRVLILLYCVFTVIKNSQNKLTNAVMAIQFAYLLNFYFCFIVFIGDLKIGAYCAAVTSCVYLIQATQPSLRPYVVRVEDASS